MIIDYQLSFMIWESWSEKARVMIYNVLLWEVILVIAVAYLFFQLFRRYRRYKERTREYQQLLLQAVSHKLGNFLAAQRVDFELFRETGSRKALQRLEAGRSFLERDFQNILRIIKDTASEEPEPEKVDLSSLTRKVLDDFKEELKAASVDLVPVRVKCIKSEVEAIVYILIENSVRYSRSKISVRTGISRNRPYLLIKNDIDQSKVHGTGVGLGTAKRLARRNDLALEWIKKDDFFLTVLTGKESKFNLL